MNAHETQPHAQAPLEMWGGLECSFVRVHDRWVDQFALTGHDDRVDDLARIAELGVRTLRYPISWERMATGRIGWDWAERRLERLRELGIRPIVGLVHHGSGPLPGGLLDPDFAPRLAEFAHAVAQRFPWVDAFTPINEPGTTARFSGLYGLWFPHASGDRAFVRCLLHEIEATRQAMRAIRAVTPHARLVQTEDIGRTHATRRLEYQADFDNERRWLPFDLLAGRVDERHALFAYLRGAGMADEEFARLGAEPCGPDIVGVNYYVTSERFLDDRLEHYAPVEHGGNGRHAYADVPAVRVRAEGAMGPAALLREAWARYRIPTAITEVQLACTREEQLRWLLDVWREAEAARETGVDVRAVTTWALLGACDWDSLLTEERGTYESGAFDLRTGAPRPTILARAIQALAAGRRFTHPVLAAPGWWHRPERLCYPAYVAPRIGPSWPAPAETESPPLLVLTDGAAPGEAFLAACAVRALKVERIASAELNATSATTLLAQHRPWAVIDCLEAETDSPEVVAHQGELVRACAEAGVKLLAVARDAAAARDRFTLHRGALVVHVAASAYPSVVVTGLDLLIDDESGVWRLTARDRVSCDLRQTWHAGDTSYAA
jgi:dTDP-4-dehydrorhamnose reductase